MPHIMQYAASGEIYSRKLKEAVTIDPLALRTEAVEFKISDGFLPSDKLIDAETMQIALQVIGASPTMAAEFDIVGLFIHYLKQQGAGEIEQFRKQVQQLPVTSVPTTPAPAPAIPQIGA